MLAVPTKKQKEACYDYLEVTHYLEEKCGKSFRDYAGAFDADGNPDAPYQDFWHWHMDHCEAHNGSYIYMPEYSYVLHDKSTPDWVKEILGLYKDFLGEDYDNEMWLEW